MTNYQKIVACFGQPDDLYDLLADGIKPHTYDDEDKDTPLQYACMNNYPEEASMLLRYGADVEFVNSSRQYPLLTAYKTNNIYLIKILLSHHANPNKILATVIRDKNIEVLHVLLIHGAMPEPMLYPVALDDDFEIFQILLKYTADIDYQDENGDTFLHHALCKPSLPKYAKLVLERGANTELRNNNEITPLHRACICNADMMVHILLTYGADKNSIGPTESVLSPLHCAINHNNYEIAEMLIYSGANINICSINGSFPITAAILNENIKILRLLLDNGAKINIKDDHDQWPLLCAVLPSNGLKEDTTLEIVNLLICYGANVNLMDSVGDTVLHSVFIRYTSVIKLFLDNGADINVINSKGLTILERAVGCCAYNTVKLLLEYGANVNYYRNKTRLPLELAVASGSLNMVELLLDHGANVSAVDGYGKTALHSAITINYTQKKKIIKELISRGAWINIWEMKNGIDKDVYKDVYDYVEKRIVQQTINVFMLYLDHYKSHALLDINIAKIIRAFIGA
jgi:ankyrin repeat protein